MASLAYQNPQQFRTLLCHRVIENLEDPDLREFRAMVAYANWSGLSLIAESLEGHLRRGGSVRTIFGVDNGVTTPDALLYAEYSRRQFTGYRGAFAFECEHSNSIFHVKYFEFRFRDRVRALVGSANLTEGGLANNHELCALIEVPRRSDVDRDLLSIWSKCRDAAAPLTGSLIRRLGKQNKLSSEARSAAVSSGKPRLRRRLPRARKPLFQRILETAAPAKTKLTILADADPLSEKPRRLYLQILEETGSGYQVQFPKATLGVFFGVGGSDSRPVRFHFPGSEPLDRQLSQFSNDTARIRLIPIRDVPRPAIISITRVDDDNYRCEVVPPAKYDRVLASKCVEQTREGSRRWGLEA